MCYLVIIELFFCGNIFIKMIYVKYNERDGNISLFTSGRTVFFRILFMHSFYPFSILYNCFHIFFSPFNEYIDTG